MKEHKSILLVEDDRIDIMLVEKAFKEINIANELVTCSNGVDALNYLKTHRSEMPGLILLDLNMPKMNGIEFLKIVKGDPEFRIIPIVVLTTSEDQQDRLESYKYSVAGYMVKPVDYFQFVEMLKSIRSYWVASKIAH